MYKLSKFTYYTKDNNHNLLLYNAYIGSRSLCKICNQSIIDSFIENNINSLSENTIESLLEKGIIVKTIEDEECKLFSQVLDVIAPKKLHLIINPTEHCNFRCKYCYETFKNGEMSEETQNKIIGFVRDNIHKYSGLVVSWFGGEPLLAKRCIENLSTNFLKICQFNKRSYRANITTNGYLLDLNTFRELLNLHINRFQITIDGIEAIHDRQRVTVNGQGTYKKIFDNLTKIKKETKNNFSIVIRTNFTKEIFDHFDEYLDSISEICENDQRFCISCYKVGNWSDTISSELLPKLISDASDGMRKIYSKILDYDKKIFIKSDYLDPGAGLCYGGKKNNFVFSADGSIHKCTINFENSDSIIGVLSGNRILFNNQYYHYISNPNRCKSYNSCFFAPVCTGDPCPLKGEKDRKCSFVKDNIDLVLKILDKNTPFKVIN